MAQEDVRKLTLTGGTTYYVTLPLKMIKSLGWRKGQKTRIRQVQDGILITGWKEEGKA